VGVRGEPLALMEGFSVPEQPVPPPALPGGGFMLCPLFDLVSCRGKGVTRVVVQ